MCQVGGGKMVGLNASLTTQPCLGSMRSRRKKLSEMDEKMKRQGKTYRCEALKEPDGDGFERCGELATWMMRRIGPICWFHKHRFEKLGIEVEYDPIVSEEKNDE